MLIETSANLTSTRQELVSTLGVIDIGRLATHIFRLKASTVGAYLGCCALLHTEGADYRLWHSLPEAPNLEVLE